jgi:recombinational DNA repair ATPase RecF
LLSPIPSFTSLPEIFDDNDTIILSSNSYQEQEEELGLDSQLILSSSEETNARNFILPRLSSMANSQESIRAPDTQITVEFSEFNIPPSQLIQATNASQQTALDSNSIRDTDQDVLLPDIPDYEEFTDVELKSQLKRFGFKTSNSRKQMIKDLRTIHTSLHSSRSSTPAANDKTTSDLLMTPDIEQDIVLDLTSELPSSQEVNSQKSIDPVVKEDIIRHLKSQPNVWQKILTYSVSRTDQ